MDDMDLSNQLSADVASTSSAAPLDVATPSSLDRPVSAAFTEVAQNSYDVFLCHRGPDTKTTLVDVLRAFLKAKRITYFVDYEMAEGVDFPSTLKQAIRNSKVHIIVLSPRFAESSWCLDEVQEIMGLQTTSKATTHVLPIFFNVEPTHVRRQQRGSEYDLSRRHKRRNKDKINQWSQALAGLANINGFVYPTGRREGHMFEEIVSRACKLLCNCLPLFNDSTWAGNKFQGQIIEEIVSRVDEFLRDCLPHYADASTWSRYDAQIKQAEQMLCNDDIVVSIGVRGPDKSRSSFAMALYDKFRQYFPAACILLDVKGRGKCKQDLVKLQMTLLEGLVNVGNIPIHDTVQGRMLLLNRLKHVKCFIVLDDIEDDDEQLRSLLVLDQHQLGRGSRLVLTSRYAHVFFQAHVKETIDLRHIGTEGDEVEERGKPLAICWESNDVHEGFIDHLNESLTMHGLDVSELRGLDLLNWAYQKLADVILVILSRSFVDDSTLMRRLDEASRSCPEVKLVGIYYGLQIGEMGLVQTEILSRSLSKRALQFRVDFQNTRGLDMGAFKSLINDIVLYDMQHESKMYVTKFPVGLKKRQAKLESQIRGSISNRKVGTFGLLGMGGLGKTTLAKSLYNRIYKEFEGAVFLHDVGTQAKKSGLLFLQQAIVKGLEKASVDPPIGNVEEGKELLTRRLHRTHILVILDDIDHISQLDALFSPLIDLGPGSVVVITTRDRSILKTANVNHVYEMDCLDQKDAKMLFYWHAFLKPFPPIELEMKAQKVIDACGCLPLSLEVIGAHVYDHDDDLDFWEDTLVHLRNAGNEIFKKLRVSVDALEKDQFKAFLDVCCFLIGKPYQTALRIWKGYGCAAVTCGEVLKSKCLITVDPNCSTIGMHDQIRDMGRYIADERTHIWDAKDASDIPQGGIDGLHGFAMIPQEKGENSKYKKTSVHCEASDLARLYRSKILLLRNLQIGAAFPKQRYDQLRWLQWQASPFVNLPPELYCSRHLRVLDLSDSERLETLWGSSQSGKDEVPESLQELNLSGCSNLKELPQFDVYLRNLEWLSLSQCKRLSHLHSSINSLKKLKFLDLSECSSLQSLPDTIEGLHSLEELDLSGCGELAALPDSVGALNMLRVCRLRRCERLQQLPEKFGELTRLTELALRGCSSLRSLPDTIEGLHSLELLDLNDCEQLAALPDSVGALNMLRVCHLSGCKRLQQLPEKFGELTSLAELDLVCCSSLQSLPDTIEGLHSLEELDLRGCRQLAALPDSVGALNMLRVCRLSECDSLQQLPEKFGELTSLTELALWSGSR